MYVVDIAGEVWIGQAKHALEAAIFAVQDRRPENNVPVEVRRVSDGEVEFSAILFLPTQWSAEVLLAPEEVA